MCGRHRGTCPRYTPGTGCSRCSVHMCHPHLSSSPRCSRPRATMKRSSSQECATAMLTFQSSSSASAGAGAQRAKVSQRLDDGSPRRDCPRAKAASLPRAAPFESDQRGRVWFQVVSSWRALCFEDAGGCGPCYTSSHLDTSASSVPAHLTRERREFSPPAAWARTCDCTSSTKLGEPFAHEVQHRPYGQSAGARTLLPGQRWIRASPRQGRRAQRAG